MLNDNRTQFVGAEKELKTMIKGCDLKELKGYAADKGMESKFVTPNAPHQNGCVKSMVKSCKFALKYAMGNHHLTPFELYTVFIANLLNQRPVDCPMTQTMDHTYAQTISCYGELLHTYRKAHF